jgi:hypothetical protein
MYLDPDQYLLKERDPDPPNNECGSGIVLSKVGIYLLAGEQEE